MNGIVSTRILSLFYNISNKYTYVFRLEFLGDALLDFLVTRYIFVHYNENVTPSKHSTCHLLALRTSFFMYVLRSSDRYSSRSIK